MSDFLSAYGHYMFDFDGTLADSAGDVIACMKRSLALNGQPDAEISPFSIGPPLDQMFRTVQPELDEAQVRTLVDTYRDLYNSLENPSTRVYSGIPDVLDRLRARGAGLYVATNKANSSAVMQLRNLGLGAYFKDVMSADSRLDVLGRKLTKGEMIRELLEQHAIEPADAAMIGDSAYDMEGGRFAGVHTMAVLYGYSHPEALLALRPEFTVRSEDWAEYLG